MASDSLHNHTIDGLFPSDSDSDSETDTDSCAIQILWERDPSLNLNWWKKLCIVQCSHRERSPSSSLLVELSHNLYNVPFPN